MRNRFTHLVKTFLCSILWSIKDPCKQSWYIFFFASTHARKKEHPTHTHTRKREYHPSERWNEERKTEKMNNRQGRKKKKKKRRVPGVIPEGENPSPWGTPNSTSAFATVTRAGFVPPPRQLPPPPPCPTVVSPPSLFFFTSSSQFIAVHGRSQWSVVVHGSLVMVVGNGLKRQDDGFPWDFWFLVLMAIGKRRRERRRGMKGIDWVINTESQQCPDTSFDATGTLSVMERFGIV